jgi:hypothetical protein
MVLEDGSVSAYMLGFASSTPTSRADKMCQHNFSFVTFLSCNSLFFVASLFS